GPRRGPFELQDAGRRADTRLPSKAPRLRSWNQSPLVSRARGPPAPRDPAHQPRRIQAGDGCTADGSANRLRLNETARTAPRAGDAAVCAARAQSPPRGDVAFPYKTFHRVSAMLEPPRGWPAYGELRHCENRRALGRVGGADSARRSGFGRRRRRPGLPYRTRLQGSARAARQRARLLRTAHRNLQSTRPQPVKPESTHSSESSLSSIRIGSFLDIKIHGFARKEAASDKAHDSKGTRLKWTLDSPGVESLDPIGTRRHGTGLLR